MLHQVFGTIQVVSSPTNKIHILQYADVVELVDTLALGAPLSPLLSFTFNRGRNHQNRSTFSDVLLFLTPIAAMLYKVLHINHHARNRGEAYSAYSFKGLSYIPAISVMALTLCSGVL